MTIEEWEENFKKEMDHLVDMFHTQNNKIGEHSIQIGEMKELEQYLAKGGLLEQILEKVDGLEKSYIHSMDRTIKSLENILRRIRKLENTLQALVVKRSECEDSTIHRNFYLGLLKILGTYEYCKYLSKDKQCLKMSPCDENYDVLSNCPAVTHVVDKETYERIKGEKLGEE